MRVGWGKMVVGVLAISGCAARGTTTPRFVPSLQTGFANQTFERRSAVDLSTPLISQSLPHSDDRLSWEPAGTDYRTISDETAACLAARQSVIGNLLDGEHESIDCLNRDCESACVAELRHDLLSLRALEQRNRDAGLALTLIYRLAEAEQNLKLVDRAFGLVDDGIAQLRRLRNEGIQTDSDEGSLIRQRLGFADGKASAVLAKGQIHERLCSLLNVEPFAEPFWPQIEFDVSDDPINIDEAVRIGLQHRADLAMTRLIVCQLDAGTLPAARQSLTSLDIGLGSVVPMIRPFQRWFGPQVDCCDVEVRRQQLEHLRDRQTRQVASEVTQAAMEIDIRHRQLAIARGKLESLKQTTAALHQQRAVGSAKPADILRSEIETLQGERELFEKFIAWKISQANLREKQGLLTVECGYQSPSNFLIGCD